MAARPVNPFLMFAAKLYGFGWEMRRRAYARGWRAPSRVDARVVSIGNLTVGGTGKTTLVLHLAQQARSAGIDVAVVCRRYRPGPGGFGDEELLYRGALGEAVVHAGTSKLELARAAAAAGAELILVDDGFSHWPLARDLDVVLVDSQDPWGGGALLPAGRLREPLRALQRAGIVVASRAPAAGPDEAVTEAIRMHAPAAGFAAGRHRLVGFSDLSGAPVPVPPACHLVTATGNPSAVRRTAEEGGVDVGSHGIYRDHHWFTPDEIRRDLERARGAGYPVLVTQKDAVRWPADAPRDGVVVIRVEWEWVSGGEAVQSAMREGASSHAGN